MTLSVYDRLEMSRGGYVPTDVSQQLHIKEQRILIGSDVHVPYHDLHTVAKFFATAEMLRVDAIVFLGDLLDNPTFSTWGNEDLNTNFDTELEQVETILEIAAEYAPRIYWSSGNHEVRWMRKMSYQGGMRRLAMLAGGQKLMEAGRLIVSDNPTLTYGADWMLTHPKQYGKVPLVVPGKIADRFQKNVVSAHAHHWGQGVSDSGKYTVIESGGLFEPRYVRYVQWQVTDHRAWVKGFVGLDHGVPTMYRGAE